MGRPVAGWLTFDIGPGGSPAMDEGGPGLEGFTPWGTWPVIRDPIGLGTLDGGMP